VHCRANAQTRATGPAPTGAADYGLPGIPDEVPPKGPAAAPQATGGRGDQFLGGFRPFRALALVVALAAVGTGIGALQTSSYLEVGPGPAFEITGHLSGATNPAFAKSGKWFFTTVDVTRTNWATWTWAQVFGSKDDFVPASVVSPEQQAQQQAAEVEEMAQAKKISAAVALAQMQGSAAKGSGVEVLGVPLGSLNATNLAPGDVITAVDGHRVTDVVQLQSLLHRLSPGPVVVSVLRARFRRGVEAVVDQSHQLDVVVTTDVAGAPKLGISTPGVGGPSGGLMFALAFTDAVSTGSLTAGRSVAGTGTLAIDGTVGAITGIQQNVAGAAKVGAGVFFAPNQ